MLTTIVRKERAELLLESKIKLLNKSVLSYVGEMKCLFHCAYPDRTKEKKVQFLMRGVKDQLFAGLIHQPPKIVAEFTQEASTIENTVDVRTQQCKASRQYQRGNSAGYIQISSRILYSP